MKSFGLSSVLEARMLRAIRFVQLPPAEQLDVRSEQVFAECRNALGALVAPVAVHAVVPVLLRSYWTMTAATLLGPAVPRTRKELVAAGVSIGNQCPYCIDAHVGSLFAHGDTGSAQAILSGGTSAIQDAESRAIAEWAAATGRSGRSPLPNMPESEAAELRATAVAFHYLNRVVSVFLPESPFFGPRIVRSVARRNMGRVLRPTGQRSRSVVLPVDLSRHLPAELSWAGASSELARGFASMELAMAQVGRELLPASVVRVVEDHLRDWVGAVPELGRGWIERALAARPPGGDDAAAELALCSAVAAYRVDAGLVARARTTLPSDPEVFALVAWSAWQAAKRVGTWIS